MRYNFDPEFAPDNIHEQIERGEILRMVLPDATTITLHVERYKEWRANAVMLALERNDDTRITGQGYSHTIFRSVVRCLKVYAKHNKVDYVMFAYRVDENREHLYRLLLGRVLWGTRFRYLDDPFDDYYQVHVDILDWLNAVKGTPQFRVFVIQRY